MYYIKKAFLKKELKADSSFGWRLFFDVEKIGLIDLAIPTSLNNEEMKESKYEIASLEGVPVNEDLLANVEEMEFKEWQIENIKLYLAILAAKVFARVSGKNLFEIFGGLLEKDSFSLPTPIVTFFHGITYGYTNLDFDEYLALPLQRNKESIREKIEKLSLINRQLAVLLTKSGYDADVNLIGGYSPEIKSTLTVFDLLTASCLENGWQPGTDCGLGVVIGSNHLFNLKNSRYYFEAEENYSGFELASLYADWHQKHKVVYLEDPASSVDKAAYKEIYEGLGSKIILAGESLFAGDEKLLRQSLSDRQVNAVVVKVDNFNSLTDLLNFKQLADRHNYTTILSDINDNSVDNWLADLAVGFGFDFARFGALYGSERVCKYNRLIEIEEILTSNL